MTDIQDIALTYVGRNLTDRKYSVLTAALYTIGRMSIYTLLGALIIYLGLGIPDNQYLYKE